MDLQTAQSRTKRRYTLYAEKIGIHGVDIVSEMCAINLGWMIVWSLIVTDGH